MAKRNLGYILVVISISSLPLFIGQHKPFLQFISGPISLVSQPGVANSDEQDNFEYSISGSVDNYHTIPNRREIFLKLYRQNQYQIFGMTVSVPKYIKLIPINSDGTFSVSKIPGGNYQLVPKTDPQHGLYFTENYPVSLQGHNPPPLKVKTPTHSPLIYFQNLLTGK